MVSEASRFRATPMDVAEWLRGLGLEQYAPAFRDNDIDGEVLRRLTGEDLRELGVASVGHRRRLLDAIMALGESQPAPEVSLTSSRALGTAGDHSGADRDMNEALRLAEEQPQVGVLCWALFWASFRCLIERDFERAGGLADRAVAVATEHGVGIWATAGQASQGAALVISDPGRAAALIGAAIVKLDTIPWLLYHSTFLCFHAEALSRLGRVVEAREKVDRALAMIASAGLSWWDAELHRIRAAVIRAEGGSSAAVREALDHAVAIAEEQGSETFRRRAAADIDVT